MTEEETEQRFVHIESMLKTIIGNQAYLETLLGPVARYIIEDRASTMIYNYQCLAAEDSRKAARA